jgi:hypothetical protein
MRLIETRIEQHMRKAWQKMGSEKGVSIPEMLVAMFIASLVAGLIAMAAYQFFIIGTDGRNRFEALGDLENASLWLGRDVSESESFTPGSGSEYGTLTTADPTIQYRYSYDAGNTALVREHVVSSVVQSTLRVARHIANQGDVVFSVTGNLVTISLSATSDDGAYSKSTSLNLAMRVR